MALTIAHAQQNFAGTEEADFIKHLERIDASTTKQLITSPRDILLAKDGKLVANGFTLTPTAFKQLCQCTAKGLYGLVADIGAVEINQRSVDQFTSPALAADIINKVVDLRFHVPDGISTKAMILNAETKTVDGIVGARYRYMPHHQLYASAVDILRGVHSPVKLCRGLLCGRRCAVSFEVGNVIHALRDGMLYPIVHITNSEAGEAGIHATIGIHMIVYNSLTSYCMLNQDAVRHVAHTHNDFDARLAALMAGVVERIPPLATNLRYYASRLGDQLDVLYADKVSEVKRRTLITKVAGYTGAALAEQVVRKAIFQGEARATIPAQVSIEDIKLRTRRDLAVLLCREGEGRYHTTREALEAAAFSILA